MRNLLRLHGETELKLVYIVKKRKAPSKSSNQTILAKSQKVLLLLRKVKAKQLLKVATKEVSKGVAFPENSYKKKKFLSMFLFSFCSKDGNI